LNLQWLDIQKRLKIKAVQDIFTTKAKVNKRNIQVDEDESKSFLHSNLLIKVIKDNYSYKQENINKITQSQYICIEAKSLLEW